MENINIETNKEIYSALISLQQDIHDLTIKKNKVGHFKYADLATIMSAIRPALIKNSLALYHTVDRKDGSQDTFLHTRVIHSSGEYIESWTPLDSFNKEQDIKGDVAGLFQLAGKNISYIKRYITMAMLNITMEEDLPTSSYSRTSSTGTISEAQVRLLKVRAAGNEPLLQQILTKLGVDRVEDIERHLFNNILAYLDDKNMTKTG